MYIPNGEISPRHFSISFLPNGTIDFVHTSFADLEKATLLLSTSVESLENATNTRAFNFWKLLNWVCVSQYWLTLYDLGQVSPVLYPSDPNGAIQSSTPINFPSTNNIFINASLFEIYTSWLNDTILPIVRLAQPDAILPTFLPLSNSNRVEKFDAMFYRSYSCLERRLKGWFSLIISVFAADYALIAGTYSLFIFFAGSFQKRKDGIPPCLSRKRLIHRGYRKDARLGRRGSLRQSFFPRP